MVKPGVNKEQADPEGAKVNILEYLQLQRESKMLITELCKNISLNSEIWMAFNYMSKRQDLI